MTRNDDTYECPWKDCHRTCRVTGQEPGRLIEAHTLNGKPCPGGGFSIDMSVMGEMRKMVKRAQGLGLA